MGGKAREKKEEEWAGLQEARNKDALKTMLQGEYRNVTLARQGQDTAGLKCITFLHNL